MSKGKKRKKGYKKELNKKRKEKKDLTNYGEEFGNLSREKEKKTFEGWILKRKE